MTRAMKPAPGRAVSVDGLSPIALPKPAFKRGGSVQAALRARRTTREIGDKPLALPLLAGLLWAACGVNRVKGPFGGPGMTAASASNSQEVGVYVALPGGAYRYEAASHRLAPVCAGDLRALAIGRGQAPAGAMAPMRLIYVADLGKFREAGFQEPGLEDPETQKAYYHVDAGMIAGNVYLFAASQGLAAWFHHCDRAGLAKRLKLGPQERVLFGQTVGFAKAATRPSSRSN